MTRHSMRMRLFTLALASCGLWPALAHPSPARADTMPRAMDPLVLNMDPAVSPGADFFQYACGRWVRENPIPAAERGWGIGNLVTAETYVQRLAICSAAAAASAPRGSIDQKVGDFWATGMDSAGDREVGRGAARAVPGEIAAIHSREGPAGRDRGRFQRLGFCPLYSLYVGQDERNSEKVRAPPPAGRARTCPTATTTSTPTPTRGTSAPSTTSTSPPCSRCSAIRPRRPAVPRAAVFRIETRPGRAVRARWRQLRDPWANYHKLSLAALDEAHPGDRLGRAVRGHGRSPYRTR